MDTAKIFMSGRSQAVRLPQEYRFDVDEVLINRVGSVVLLVPKAEAFHAFLDGIHGFSDDFFADGRNQGRQQERNGL